MSLESLLQTYFVGSLLLMAFVLLLSALLMGVWLAGLVHCLKHRHDKDRLVWVLVTLFGGPIGAVIYFLMGRIKPNVADTTVVESSSSSRQREPAFDHVVMGDPMKRAQSIQEALWQEAANRRGRR